MSLVVLIPWRPQPSRVAAFDAVASWYRDNVPGVEIRAIDSPDEVFNLSRCRNIGIAGVLDPHQVVVINDADTLPELDALLEAVDGARTSGRVHLPYTEYHWLGASGTAQHAGGMPLAACDFELVRGACSGIYVTTPATWWAHGGQDEIFRGWGYEDAAWFLAHTTLLGSEPARHTGCVYALHHEAQPRTGTQYEANAARMERYRAAAGDPGAMRQLVGDGQAEAGSAPAEAAEA
jgi:hypothetical protein